MISVKIWPLWGGQAQCKDFSAIIVFCIKHQVNAFSILGDKAVLNLYFFASNSSGFGENYWLQLVCLLKLFLRCTDEGKGVEGLTY